MKIDIEGYEIQLRKSPSENFIGNVNYFYIETHERN